MQETQSLLKDYLSLFAKEGLVISCDAGGGILEQEIRAISYDTREAQDASLFFCKGAHFRPEYITEAKDKGAVCIVTEVAYEPCPLPRILVSDIRRCMVLAAFRFYGNAPGKLTTVGITGTKGKSTIIYQLSAILRAWLGTEAAYLSSIDNYDGVQRGESRMTTPEVFELHRHYANAVRSGIPYLLLEVSSQALKVGRVEGINCAVGAFHNIGSDHIGSIEHPDFEDYYRSKLKIFDHCRAGCVNLDADHADETLSYAKARCEKVLTYGESPGADIYGHDIHKTADGIAFSVRTPSYEEEFSITMPGIFNVSNALCSIAVSEALGVPKDHVRAGLMAAKAPGRMEVLTSEDGKVTIIVDYAHNRMSFEALLKAVRLDHPGKETVAVFGCPGKKAYLRRRDLGEIAGSFCDRLIITEEDSGEEPFASIAADIEKAALPGGADVLVCEDRGEAIRRAVFDTDAPKVVLLTGKGRETRMKRGLTYVNTPSDLDYAEACLREYKRKDQIPCVDLSASVMPEPITDRP